MVEDPLGRACACLQRLPRTSRVAESVLQVQRRPPSAGRAIASLRARCLADESGEPLAGCTALLRAVGPTGSVESWDGPSPVLTGADGTFELVFTTPGEGSRALFLDLEVRTAGRVPRTARWMPHGWGNGIRLDVGEVRLARGYPLRGRLVDVDDLPVAGLRVRLSGFPLAIGREFERFGAPRALEAECGEDGSFAFDALPRGRWPVSIAGPAARVLRPTWLQVEDGVTDALVVVKRFPALSGIVVDEADRPVEGVWVGVRSANPSPGPSKSWPSSVRTGNDGSFSIHATEDRPRPVRLECDDPGPCEGFDPQSTRSEEHTSELQSLRHLVCRLLLEKKKKNILTKTKQHTQKHD